MYFSVHFFLVSIPLLLGLSSGLYATSTTVPEDTDLEYSSFAAPHIIVQTVLTCYNDPSRDLALKQMAETAIDYHCPKNFRQELDAIFFNEGPCHIYSLPNDIIRQIIFVIDEYRTLQALNCTSKIFKKCIDDMTSHPTNTWLNYQLENAPTLFFDSKLSTHQYYSIIRKLARFYFKEYPQDLYTLVKRYSTISFMNLLHGLVDSNLREPYANWITYPKNNNEIFTYTVREECRHLQEKILSLPLGVFFQTSLKLLALRRSNLIYVSPLIKNLVNLETLDLSFNDLEYLPSEVGQLTHLKNLNLSSNHFRFLPPEISSLQNLKTLTLTNNLIQTIPFEYFLVINLSILYINGNKIDFLSPEFFSINVRHFVHLDSHLEKFKPLNCKMNLIFHPSDEQILSVYNFN